jgi:hypothetical protein
LKVESTSIKTNEQHTKLEQKQQQCGGAKNEKFDNDKL